MTRLIPAVWNYAPGLDGGDLVSWRLANCPGLCVFEGCLRRVHSRSMNTEEALTDATMQRQAEYCMCDVHPSTPGPIARGNRSFCFFRVNGTLMLF